MGCLFAFPKSPEKRVAKGSQREATSNSNAQRFLGSFVLKIIWNNKGQESYKKNCSMFVYCGNCERRAEKMGESLRTVFFVSSSLSHPRVLFVLRNSGLSKRIFLRDDDTRARALTPTRSWTRRTLLAAPLSLSLALMSLPLATFAIFCHHKGEFLLPPFLPACACMRTCARERLRERILRQSRSLISSLCCNFSGESSCMTKCNGFPGLNDKTETRNVPPVTLKREP